ncbi:MAG: hypothetical protein LBD80_00425 [Tannerella sp.]|jgi:hypothetical protein|nr:hypothetical protein [Tannerella sp.]
MKIKFIVVFIIYLTVDILIGCNGIDNYSVSPGHHLSFSTDTVSFDTVFTSIGSSTYGFMVYNNNSEDLNIQEIRLAGEETSGFRLNVDGRAGEIFNNIPIWRKDSLYVLVEVTVNPNGENQPFVIYDSVIFTTNGIRQAVLLEVYGQNAHILRGTTVFDKDTTLVADRPYLIYDSVKIAENVTVNIEKGVSFYMHNNAKWIIEGTIKTHGVREKPVVFRGDRLGAFNYVTTYDKIWAQWDGIFFGSASFNNEMTYTMIRNGISGLTFKESTPERKKLTLDDCVITNMGANGLYAVNCHIEAVNTELSNAGVYLLMLAGGKHRFIHCTVTNYMPSVSGNAMRMCPTLTLSDNLKFLSEDSEDDRKFPLLQAFFDNCIIDGGNSSTGNNTFFEGEIQFFSAGEIKDLYGNDDNFNYRFNHCFIKIKNVTGSRFINCLFEKSPTYVKSEATNENDESDFVFDYHLDSASLVIGRADPLISELYPVDMDGVNRLRSPSGPSIGAYEFVEQKSSKR